ELDILTFVCQHIAAAIVQKRNEKAIRDSEERFRAVADTATSAIYVHDRNQFHYVNRAAEQMTGYSRDDLMKMSPWDLLHPDFDQTRALEPPASMRAGKPLRMEFKIVRKDGESRWWDFSGCILDFAGKSSLLGTALDITERKQSEVLQDAMYRIATKASSAVDLNELYAFIHKVLGELMYGKNCYIALYDKDRDAI